MRTPRPAIAARKLSTLTNNLYQIVTKALSHVAAAIGANVGSAGTIAMAAAGSVIPMARRLKLVRWWMIAVVSGAALAWYSHGPGDPMQAATQALIAALWT